MELEGLRISPSPLVLEHFFKNLKEQVDLYTFFRDRKPTTIIINMHVLKKLVTMDGFYTRRELLSQVTEHAPVVRYFKLKEDLVLEIVESSYEPYVKVE